MKLFLHWLRWDLCRFRWMLGAWTLLVPGYAAFLGWMHADILTIDPDWMAWSGPVAMLLGAVELLMLFHLFSTDPAGGVDPFWKTRPPTGFAVAGSKLVLALGFFVVLPMAEWFTMEALCVKPGAVTHEWKEGVSWTRFLWLTQTLVVSVLALGAAVVRTPWQIPLNVGLGFAPLLVPPLLSMVFNGPVNSPVEFWAAGNSLKNSSIFSLLLLPVCGVFLLTRRSRTIARAWYWVVLAGPAVILPLALALPAWRPNPEVPPRYAMGDPVAAERIQVKGTAIRQAGAAWRVPGSSISEQNNGKESYGTTLNVTGLPDGLPADAAWRELRLTAPDGRVVEADHAAMQRMTSRLVNQRTNVVDVPSLVFNRKQAESLALLPCRAEGTLRVMLRRHESAVLPIEPGAVLQTPLAWYALRAEDFHQGRWRRILTWTPRRSVGASETMELEWVANGGSQPVGIEGETAWSGFLMASSLNMASVLNKSQRRNLAALRLNFELGKGVRAGEWRLKMTWWVPDGFVDLPVVLDPFVLPGHGYQKNLPERIAAVPFPADASPERVKAAVSYVLILAGQPCRSGEPEDSTAAALYKWMQQVPADHLPVLLELARENLPGDRGFSVMDYWLRARIAALMTASKAEQLARAEPLLFSYLSEALEARGLATDFEGMPARLNPTILTDQALAEHWDREAVEKSLPMDVLEEAISRGLPWSKLAIVELIRLEVAGVEMDQMFRFMNRFSDCPEDPDKARRWLARNAERLEWDGSLRLWVPAPEPP